MKNLTFIVLLSLIFFVQTHGQENDVKINNEIVKIKLSVKSIDSIGNIKNEGISEGPIIYTSIFKKNKGWSGYFLNEENSKKIPLRIRYHESQHKGNENINFYYQNGALIFAESTKSYTRGKLKKQKPIIKKYYFTKEKLLFKENASDADLKNLLYMEKIIRKMIYE